MKVPIHHRSLRKTALIMFLATTVVTAVYSRRLLPSVRALSNSGNETTAPQPSVTSSEVDARYGKLPLRFEANEGQTDRSVKFLSHGPGYDLFLTSSGAVLSLRKPQASLDKLRLPAAAVEKPKSDATELSVLRLTMNGANPSAHVDGVDELPGKVNYFTGSDRENWHTNIPTYLKVHYSEIYPGVDLVYYGNRTELEYDFIVAPGGNPEAITFQIEGADRISLDREGGLVLTVNQHEVRLRKPLIYQLTDDGSRREVKGEYKLKGKQVGFKVRAFDSRKPLIIDPVLSYSTLLGSGSREYGVGIAVDSSGNAYITGSASSVFPTTPGAFQTSNPSFGLPAAFITKLDSTGTNLLYSTYLSGSNGASSAAIAVDSFGNAYVTGYTSSGDFPTVNAIRGTRSNFYKSVDSGGHWNGQVIGPANAAVNVLAADPLTPNTMYAGMNPNGGGGIYKTTDGGNTWVALAIGLTNPNCAALAVDPITPTTLYASLVVTSGSSVGGLYKSTNGGTSWTKLTAGLGGTTVTALAIDSTSPNTVYAGSSFVGVFKSTDGGASWNNSSTGINFGGTGAIAVDPNHSQTIYCSAGGGGVFKSTNGGANWAQVNTGLTTTTVLTLNIDPASNVYAGTAGGGIFKSGNGGGNWNPINGSIAGYIPVASVGFNPTASTTI